jgi:hypothetical protein
MLFNAQAIVFGKYLVSRQGYEFIGTLVDAGINGTSIDETLIKHNAPDLTQMDSDFRRWLMDRALVIGK